MAIQHTDSQIFTNYSDNALFIKVQPDEIIRVRENGKPLTHKDYSGKDCENEIRIPPYARVERFTTSE